MRGLATNVNLADLRGFILGLSVTALHEEKGSVGAKAKQISLINSFVGFLDEVEVWQAHNRETK